MTSRLKCFQCSERSQTLILAEAGNGWDTHSTEAIDSVGDFLRFVDETNRSEVSSREFARVELANRRSIGPRAACVPATRVRRFFGGRLTLSFRLVARSEND
jgi:hypothetical protein